MSYSYQNKSRHGGDSFRRKMVQNIIGVTSIFIIVVISLTLGFLGNATIKGYNKVELNTLNKEVDVFGLAEEEIENEDSEQYYLASIMLYSQVVEDSTTTVINGIANDKKEQRLKKEEERRLAEEERRKKQEHDKQIAEQKKKEAPETVSRGGYSVTKKELDLLERIVMAEAGAEPYQGMIAVVNVIMNRVAHKSYPNSINGVVFQKGQFTPAGNGKIWRVKPSKTVKNAVREALDGKRVVEKDVLFFLNPDLATDHTIPKTKTFVKRIGGHAFYK